MADTAASVLTQLKNKGKETGRGFQLCLQFFCQEEFLRRLEKSQYAENLVLKGGLFIYSITDFDSRVTVDVDFLLRKVPNTPEKLKKVLEEIIATPTGNDFVTFEIANITPITVVKNMLVSALPWSQRSRIIKPHSASTLMWEMLLCQIRKSAGFRPSWRILQPLW